MCRIGLIILAAGGSSRLGRPKQLVTFQDVSLIRRAAQTALSSICHPITVVLGAYADRIRKELQNLPVHIVDNPEWEQGMGSSIKKGLAATLALELAGAPATEATLFTLSDQPFLTHFYLNELAAAYSLHGGIVASAYNHTLGVPAIFPKEHHPELLSLTPGQGAKCVIERHRDKVHALAFPDGIFDIDTPQDYELLLKREPSRTTTNRPPQIRPFLKKILGSLE